MNRIRIALIGTGQVVRDQHVPVLECSPDFELLAAVSISEPLSGSPTYPDLDALCAAHTDVQAVAVCTPPQVRFELARQALQRGLHVMLEKPPCCTLAEVEGLVDIAANQQLALFAAWHSRAAPAVEHARHLLSGSAIRSIEIRWREDVRVLHPGQAWLWEEGGLGVFDPGINPLSIITYILPGRIGLERADLNFPVNCRTPIAAKLRLRSSGGVLIKADLDFLFSGNMTWEIDIDSDVGQLRLSRGGAMLHVDGEALVDEDEVAYANLHAEYAGLYATFAGLVRDRRVDVDSEPLRLVLEAMSTGERHDVAAFHE